MQIDKKIKTQLIKNFKFYRRGSQEAFERFLEKLEKSDTYEKVMELITDFLIIEVAKLHIGIMFNPFCVSGYFKYPFYKSKKCPYRRIHNDGDFCYMKELITAKIELEKAIEKFYQGEKYE